MKIHCRTCDYTNTINGQAVSVKAIDSFIMNAGELKDIDFDFSQYPFDVTDSLGVTLTLIGKKWNSDIVEKIRELKKEQKNTINLQRTSAWASFRF